jgi:hypothetical protein
VLTTNGRSYQFASKQKKTFGRQNNDNDIKTDLDTISAHFAKTLKEAMRYQDAAPWYLELVITRIHKEIIDCEKTLKEPFKPQIRSCLAKVLCDIKDAIALLAKDHKDHEAAKLANRDDAAQILSQSETCSTAVIENKDTLNPDEFVLLPKDKGDAAYNMSIKAGYTRQEIVTSEQVFIATVTKSTNRIEQLITGEINPQMAVSFEELANLQFAYKKVYSVASEFCDRLQKATSECAIAECYHQYFSMDNKQSYPQAVIDCTALYEKIFKLDPGGIDSYITPAQRLPRHVMLIKQLQENSSDAQEVLESSSNLVQASAQALNSALSKRG